MHLSARSVSDEAMNYWEKDRVDCEGPAGSPGSSGFAISFSVTLLPSAFSVSSVRVAATRTEEMETEQTPQERVVCSDTE